MAIRIYDTFISYRRNTGSQPASRIYDYLLSKNRAPFLDVAEINGGRFDDQLRNRVRQAFNFVLVLSANALDRCNEENDWLTEEIYTALKYNKNIVLAMEDNFIFPPADSLPEKIRPIVNFQAVLFNQKNFNERIGALERMMHFPMRSPVSLSDSDYGKNYRSITGSFMSVYEDYENGELVLRTAPAELTQHLSRIKGTTTFDRKRTWLLDAKIYNRTKIAGIYTATDKYDEGVGTFFLEIESFNRMSGYWAGYDNMNKKLTYGAYTFTRLFSNYKIEEASQKDYPAVCSIADKQLGQDYVSAKTLRQIQNSSCNDNCLIARHETTGKVLGFCIYKTLLPQEAEALCRGLKKTFGEFGDEIGYLATLAVSEKFHNNGIASALTAEAHKRFEKLGIGYIISTAWKRAGKINIGNILLRNGYNVMTEIPDYWYEDSVKKGYLCPQCGNPCHCSCVIFEKFL